MSFRLQKNWYTTDKSAQNGDTFEAPTLNQSNSHSKPWINDLADARSEKLDRLAMKIMTDEALKIINEAYEAIFRKKRHKSWKMRFRRMRKS